MGAALTSLRPPVPPRIGAGPGPAHPRRAHYLEGDRLGL
jgi:hypothetical protein